MLPPCSFTLLDHRAGFRIEGRGRPVVLLHGSTGSKGPWRALVERLARSHRMIVVDLHDRYEKAFVDSVLRIGLLPGERFHLIGQSQGAAMAMRVAQATPRRLLSLALCEPAGLTELRRVAVPTMLPSCNDEPMPVIERFIRDVDARELQPQFCTMGRCNV